MTTSVLTYLIKAPRFLHHWGATAVGDKRDQIPHPLVLRTQHCIFTLRYIFLPQQTNTNHHSNCCHQQKTSKNQRVLKHPNSMNNSSLFRLANNTLSYYSGGKQWRKKANKLQFPKIALNCIWLRNEYDCN